MSNNNKRAGMACARAIVKYGEAAILRAYDLNRHQGEGARTIAQSLMRDVFDGNTRGADCAIDAGWYMVRTAYSVDFVLACFCVDADIRRAADARNRTAIRARVMAPGIEVQDATMSEWADARQLQQWATSGAWQAPSGPDLRPMAPVYGDE